MVAAPSFNPYSNGMKIEFSASSPQSFPCGFNPYSNGMKIEWKQILSSPRKFSSFNPYSNGMKIE